MIHPGDTLANPVTGETLIFHRTSVETGGESVHRAGRYAPPFLAAGERTARFLCEVRPALGFDR